MQLMIGSLKNQKIGVIIFLMNTKEHGKSSYFLEKKLVKL